MIRIWKSYVLLSVARAQLLKSNNWFPRWNSFGKMGPWVPGGQAAGGTGSLQWLVAHFQCQVLNTHPPYGAHVDTDETETSTCLTLTDKIKTRNTTLRLDIKPATESQIIFLWQQQKTSYLGARQWTLNDHILQCLYSNCHMGYVLSDKTHSHTRTPPHRHTFFHGVIPLSLSL